RRAEEARRVLHQEIRLRVAQASLPRRRTARRTDAQMDQRVAWPTGDRPLLANGDRMAASLGTSRRREDAAQDGLAELSRVRLRRAPLARGDRQAGRRW